MKLGFSFSAYGFRYESGLKCLRDSFSAAVEGVQGKIRDEDKAWDNRSGDYGLEPECADDGGTIFDPEHIYEYKKEALRDAHTELRKSFAITIYHYWERNIRVFGKLPEGNHDELIKASTSLGYTIPTEFSRVYRLANALKHNNRGSLNKLYEVWPEVCGVSSKAAGVRDWYSGIVLTDDHIYELIEITKQAGPSAMTKTPS